MNILKETSNNKLEAMATFIDQQADSEINKRTKKSMDDIAKLVV